MHWSKNPQLRKKVLKKLSRALKGRISPRKGVKLSEATKKKISESMKGKTSSRKGVKLNRDTKDKISKKFYENYKKENHYNYGKKLSKETCKKKSDSLKKAFKEGKMEYMKKVWLKNGKRWRSEQNPRWKPIGSKRHSHGYVLVKTKDGWEREHRLIMEKYIGRKLKKNEITHHINGEKDDNRIENLKLMTSKEHKSLHTKDNINKK